ncbi:hypothetical protein BDP27DRAFT_1261363 [Rhodocollybia butyracea]|uniref:Uncharacterized protein n=1 Tax=Rhodocollybia butyracea TaxID=206335 RepID=A0A9P5UB05_9AGAR|nr:hypothetical protein BDP27DRAFT_1261363 [Rhodocollybia butyracea]
MSASVQASPTKPSIAENIPLELWERIAFYANAREDSFLGPPSDITNLCSVCRSLNIAIRFDNNPSLYARLFCFKFDYQAPLRRLGQESLTTRAVAQEFKKRILTLKQIRRRECNMEDLWTCYLMMLENDGRNERQLIEWAHLYGFLKRETCLRFAADSNSPSNWFKDTERTSLLLWLWWMAFSRDDVRIENSHVRDSLVCHVLQIFVAANFRYPSLMGYESHLHPAKASQGAWSSTPSTPIAQVNHYSKKLSLATPLLSQASLLVWTIRLETIREITGFDRSAISALPLDRESAPNPGPTQLDVLNFHEVQIQAPIHASLTLSCCFREQILASDHEEGSFAPPLTGSRRYDTDWYRSVICSDACAASIHSNHLAYERGTLTGLWEGFFVQTSLEAHRALVLDPDRTPSETIALYRHPLYFALQEHHCLNPDIPLTPGKDCLGGDDVLNAWLPQGLKIIEFENEIEVYDPRAQRSVRYQTLVPEALREMVKNKSGGENSYPEDARRVNDILITGKTSEEHGAAWGHYLFVGRVRLWDGFIALLRTPRDPARSELGRWLFRGYIHDHNLVGHWRETSTPPKVLGYGGGFIAKNQTPLNN